MQAWKAGQVPEKTCAVGPVIQTPSSSQRTRSSPPSSTTVTRAPRAPAARPPRHGAGGRARGQRDPRPRSQTRIRGGRRDDLHHLHVGPSGKERVMLVAGPKRARSTASASGHEEGAVRVAHGGRVGAALDGQAQRVHRAASGISCQRRRGGPMLTAVSPPLRRAPRAAPRRSDRHAVAAVRSISARATQRVALPQRPRPSRRGSRSAARGRRLRRPQSPRAGRSPPPGAGRPARARARA
jgi:hypothetical protein